jgi:hypothetical protein
VTAPTVTPQAATPTAPPVLVNAKAVIEGDLEPKPGLRHLIGRLIAIFPKEYDGAAKGYDQNTTQETFTVDYIILDGPPFSYGDNAKKYTPATRGINVPCRIDDAKISQGNVVKNLAKLERGKMLFGRVAHRQSAISGNMFFAIDPPNEGDDKLFWAFWEATDGGYAPHANRPIDIEDPNVKAARLAAAAQAEAMKTAGANQAAQVANQGAAPSWATGAPVAAPVASAWGAPVASAASVVTPAAVPTANAWGQPVQVAPTVATVAPAAASAWGQPAAASAWGQPAAVPAQSFTVPAQRMPEPVAAPIPPGWTPEQWAGVPDAQKAAFLASLNTGQSAGI